ncbi:MAG: AAA family ATPase [Lactobacillaceae bacterium]|nr:AAA family ATPase [Lactobacillaceae bacterium]
MKAWSTATFKKELHALERWHKVTYNEQQVAAIEAALNQPLTILTGGPGTGKTTILNAVVALFAKKNHFQLEIRKGEEEDFPISQLAAPTGRAAKRLAEMTDLPAKTIHRLLGLNRTDDQFEPLMGQDIHGQLLIVDEMSMVDQQLFQALLQALPSGMQVLLVGDQGPITISGSWPGICRFDQ